MAVLFSQYVELLYDDILCKTFVSQLRTIHTPLLYACMLLSKE